MDAKTLLLAAIADLAEAARAISPRLHEPERARLEAAVRALVEAADALRPAPAPRN